MTRQFTRLALLAISVMALTVILTVDSPAQAASRVRFARGAVSAVAAGSLNGYRDKRIFVIKVRAGQTLTTEQVGGRPITVEVIKPDGQPFEGDMDLSCHNRHEVTPTEAGDYRLVVTECQKADRWRGRFRLKVTVR